MRSCASTCKWADVTVNAEIASCRTKGGRIDVRFNYNRQYVEAMRTVAGRSFVGDIGDKHWHVPLDMETCRSLRRAFGDSLAIGPQLRSWATKARREEEALGSIATSTTGRLVALWDKLPTLAQAIHLGPLGKYMSEAERVTALAEPGSYQAADVEFIVSATSPLVANEQGTGKTPTYIASVWEAGLEDGAHLVICPKTAIGGTWLKELKHWQSDAKKSVEIFACVDGSTDGDEVLERFRRSTADVRWVVVNPAMITWRKDPEGPLTVTVTGKKARDACTCSKQKSPHLHYRAPFPALTSTPWKTVCIDECHKGSIRNHRSLTAKALKYIRAHGKVTAMSGTPMKKMGGSDIWGILNYLRPDVFSSFWRFAGDFYEIEETDYGKKVGKLRTDREDAMWRLLTPFVIRRLKKEVAPWLPEKLYVPVDCFMGKAQADQYRKIQEGEAVQLEDGVLETKGTLDMFTRLRQFASARWTGTEGNLRIVDSCKVDALVEKMDEVGMFDEGSTRKQLVFSQSRKMILFVAEELRKRGLRVDMIHGGINKAADRQRIMDDFQEGDTQVLCIVTTAGGVSLTLDAADEVHLLDEAWSHDEDEQAEDRAHRVSRIHQVTVYIYRTIGTIDQYVADSKEEKKDDHEVILDVRRKIIESWYKAA
jgi:SNF2 family DNA or RNA helicase